MLWARPTGKSPPSPFCPAPEPGCSVVLCVGQSKPRTLCVPVLNAPSPSAQGQGVSLLASPPDAEGTCELVLPGGPHNLLQTATALVSRRSLPSSCKHCGRSPVQPHLHIGQGSVVLERGQRDLSTPWLRLQAEASAVVGVSSLCDPQVPPLLPGRPRWPTHPGCQLLIVTVLQSGVVLISCIDFYVIQSLAGSPKQESIL